MAKALVEDFTVRRFFDDENQEVVDIRYVLEDDADTRFRIDVVVPIGDLPASVNGAWTAFLNTLRAEVKVKENIL